MKKLVLTLALAISSLSVMNAAMVSNGDLNINTVVEEEFQEIPVEQVPDAVVQALATAHEGATIQKAYINEEGQFKLEVTTQDGTQGVLYADADGNWLDISE